MADKKISQLSSVTTPLSGTEEIPAVQSGTTKKATVADFQSATVAAGTANGVQFLNASKAPTTSTRLTFDGSEIFKNSGGVIQLNDISGSAAAGTRMAGGGTLGVDSFSVFQNGAGAYILNSAGTSLNLGTNNINSQLTVGTSGNVAVAFGNLIIGTAGKGIDFSVNSAAAGMTSELLDDYETGTWTPTYTPASGAFGTIVYNSNTFGRYTKVGNCVFVVGLIITDEFNVGTGVGQGRISGLPFTPSPSASASINYSTGFNTNHPTGSFTSGADIYLTQRATSLGASATFNSASFTTGVSSFGNYVYFHMNYTV